MADQLSNRESRELTEQLAFLARSGMPITEGLLAVAEEIRSERLSRVFRGIATRIQNGASLEQALQADQKLLPRYVAGLIQAGVRTGNVAEVLVELVDHHQSYRATWRQVAISLVYPAVLLTVTLIMIVIVLVGVVPSLASLSFDLPDWASDGEPQVNDYEQLLWLGREGIWFFAGFVGALVAMVLLAGSVLGKAFLSRVIATVPAFGKLVLWQSYAEFARLLRCMIRYEIPLAEALALTATGVRNANVAQVARKLQAQIKQGQSLADAIDQSADVPAVVATAVRWGEQTGDTVDALKSVYEMLEEAIRLRADLLSRVLPPITFILIAAVVILVFGRVFFPFVTTLRAAMSLV